MKRTSVVPFLLLLASPALVPGALCAQEEDPPGDVFELEGLVITASPTPRPAGAVASHTSILEGEELRARGLTRLSDALREVAGLTVVRAGSWGAQTSVFLRGGESDYVQVLIDGVPVNQPGGSFDFAGLTLENVERIEVVRGPASALYGSDAVSGVVHVVTRTGGGDPRGEVGIRAGSHGRLEGSLTARGGSDRLSWGVGLTRHEGEGLLPFNNRHRNSVLTGSVRLAPDTATRADLSVRLADRVYHFPTDGSGAVTDRNAFTFGDEATLGLGASRRLTDAVRLGLRLSVHQTDGGTDDAPDGPADTLGFYGFSSLDHMRRATADVRTDILLGRAVASAGVELEEQRQRSFTESLSEFGPSADRSTYERANRAGYVHLTWDGEPVALHGGARLEDNERYGTFATWQAGLAWRLRDGTRLRAAAGRGVKEPTFFETFATGFARGNPDLDPERSTSVEGGVEQEVFSGRLVLAGTVFRQTFEDLIQYDAAATAPAPSYVNVAAARAVGAELEAEVSLGAARASVAWTWVETKVDDAGLDQGPDAAYVEGDRLLRRPTHEVRLQASRALGGRGAVTGSLRWVGTRDDRDFATFPAVRVELPAFAVVGLGARMRVAGRDGRGTSVTLSLRADNLLDESYQEIAGFEAPGRTLTAGVQLGLGGGG